MALQPGSLAILGSESRREDATICDGWAVQATRHIDKSTDVRRRDPSNDILDGPARRPLNDGAQASHSQTVTVAIARSVPVNDRKYLSAQGNQSSSSRKDATVRRWDSSYRRLECLSARPTTP